MGNKSASRWDSLVHSYLKLSTTNVSDALDRLQINGAPAASCLFGTAVRRSSAGQ